MFMNTPIWMSNIKISNYAEHCIRYKNITKCFTLQKYKLLFRRKTSHFKLQTSFIEKDAKDYVFPQISGETKWNTDQQIIIHWWNFHCNISLQIWQMKFQFSTTRPGCIRAAAFHPRVQK